MCNIYLNCHEKKILFVHNFQFIINPFAATEEIIRKFSKHNVKLIALSYGTENDLEKEGRMSAKSLGPPIDSPIDMTFMASFTFSIFPVFPINKLNGCLVVEGHREIAIISFSFASKQQALHRGFSKSIAGTYSLFKHFKICETTSVR